MDERILVFLEALKRELKGLPEKEIQDAVGYYSEYLTDSLEEGKDLDRLLEELGPVKQIALSVKAETNFNETEKNPRLSTFSRIFKNSLKSIKNPFAYLFIPPFLLIVYTVALCFYGMVFACGLAAVLSFLGLVYEALKIPCKFALEIAGTLGMALFAAGLIGLCAYGFYKLAGLFIRFSSRLIRLIRRKNSGIYRVKIEAEEKGTVAKRKWRLKLCYLFIILGLVLFSFSGLPLRLFGIFNSQPPENIIEHTHRYPSAGISEISIYTEHSRVRLITGDTTSIVFSYGQSEWLDYDLSQEGGVIKFRERSNGRLPLFPLVSLHESLTELAVTIPEGFTAERIDLQSKGGHFSLQGTGKNLHAETLNGNIDFLGQNLLSSINLQAQTKRGSILIDDLPVGSEYPGGIRYERKTGSGNIIDLITTGGIIRIY